MSFKKRTYSGKGKIYIGPYDGDGALAFIGNCSSLTFNHNESKISVPDFTTSGGGEYDSHRRIDAVTLDLAKWDILLPANLARATRGKATEETSTSEITNESHKFYPGGLIPFKRIPNPDETVTVTDAGSPSQGTYNEGTDYERTPSGIVGLSSSMKAAGSAITVSYTPLKSDVVEALAETGKTFRLFFEGLNEADSDRPVLIDVHRYKPGVAQSLGWISNEFLSMETSGDVLADPTVTTPGLSRFYRVRYAQPA
jgi:hypothetical protein